MKKTAALRKENESLINRIRALEASKIVDLQDSIRDKDKTIEKLQGELKLHERFEKKEMTQDIYKKAEEAESKIKALSEEIVHLKKKMAEQRKASEIQEKSLKFHQSRTAELEKGRSLSRSPEKEAPKETYTLLQQ